MVVLLGASGYVGRAIFDQLRARGIACVAPAHADLDLTSHEAVHAWVAHRRIDYVINAVGFTGRPNVDGTERERWRCLQANTIIPGVLADVLGRRGIRWGHVSSGCIFHGARADGSGFTEEDEPAFAIGDPRAGWYARTKWMAEVLLREHENVLIWRMRIPFDEFDHERNYLSKVLAYDRLLEVRNSITQRQEFAAAVVDSMERHLPGGLYHVTNPGSILTSEVAEAMRRHGLTDKAFTFFRDEPDFLSAPGRVFRASCVLNSEKLAGCGIRLREIHEALEWTLAHWTRA